MSKGPSSSPESLETTGVGVDLQRLVLDSDHYDAFMHVLDNPPSAGAEAAIAAASGPGVAEITDEPPKRWSRCLQSVARMSGAKSGVALLPAKNPDCAALHPGYACW